MDWWELLASLSTFFSTERYDLQLKSFCNRLLVQQLQLRPQPKARRLIRNQNLPGNGRRRRPRQQQPLRFLQSNSSHQRIRKAVPRNPQTKVRVVKARRAHQLDPFCTACINKLQYPDQRWNAEGQDLRRSGLQHKQLSVKSIEEFLNGKEVFQPFCACRSSKRSRLLSRPAGAG